MKTKLLVSIVSHGQIELVAKLLDSFLPLVRKINCKIVVTVNIPENLSPISNNIDKLVIIENLNPKGFGANHNYAFSTIHSQVFLVLNPDILFEKFDINYYINLASTDKIGAVSCAVKNPAGELEDNIRDDITIKNLLSRHLLNKKNKIFSQYEWPIKIEWCAGMIIFFNSSAYAKINGFDERFYMYLEDADICKRLRNMDFIIINSSKHFVIHDARRDSRKLNKLFFIHILSMIKYLIRYGY